MGEIEFDLRLISDFGDGTGRLQPASFNCVTAGHAFRCVITNANSWKVLCKKAGIGLSGQSR
jgi:hypothetical protein